MKNLEPTPHKVQKEREKGNLLKLEFLAGTVGFAASVAIAYVWFKSDFTHFVGRILTSLKLDGGSAINLVTQAGFTCLAAAALYFFTATTVGIISNKGIWLRKKREFEIASNIKTVFISTRKALLQLIFMVSFIVVVFFLLENREISNLPKTITGISILCLGLLLLLELILEPVLYRKKLMMDYKELHDEMKENEGDPLVKSAQKNAHKVMLYEEVRARVKACKFIVVG